MDALNIPCDSEARHRVAKQGLGTAEQGRRGAQQGRCIAWLGHREAKRSVAKALYSSAGRIYAGAKNGIAAHCECKVRFSCSPGLMEPRGGSSAGEITIATHDCALKNKLKSDQVKLKKRRSPQG